MTTAYETLMAYVRDTEALGQVAGRLGWDQETVMPDGALDQRAEEHGAMAGVLHARRTSPVIAEGLAAVQTTDPVALAQLHHIRRSHDRATKVPASLAGAIARETSRAHRIWAQARADEDVAAFLPALSRVLDLKREEAQAIAGGADPYDAMLDDFEPGATGAQLTAMFGAMRPRLVALRDRVRQAPPAPQLQGTFPEDGQMALTRELAAAFGYDLNRGRIDKAVHPFSSAS